MKNLLNALLWLIGLGAVVLAVKKVKQASAGLPGVLKLIPYLMLAGLVIGFIVTTINIVAH